MKKSGILLLILLWNAVSIASEAEDELQAGIDAFNRGDLIAAIDAYEVAAAAGSAEAQARLAWIYDEAEENERAFELYRASAGQGNADGQFGLAEMYAKGEGVTADPARAVEFYRRAAENGHVRAMRVLVSAFRTGTFGLQPDEDRAAYWERQIAIAEQVDRDDR